MAEASEASQSRPRKQHLVPKSYLERWADPSNIRCTDLELNRQYKTAPSKAARITDYYRIESDDIDAHEVPPLLAETLLGIFEGRAKPIVDRLIEDPLTVTAEEGAAMAQFLALQLVRGQDFRSRTKEMSAELVRQMLPEVAPTPDLEEGLQALRSGKFEAVPQDSELIHLMLGTAHALGPRFIDRKWVVCETSSVIPTCDEPVVLVHGPGRARGDRTGLDGAGAVIFPLDPSHLLVLFRKEIAERQGFIVGGPPESTSLDALESEQMAMEIAMNCHRWIFEQSSSDLVANFSIGGSKPSMVASPDEDVARQSRAGFAVRFSTENRWASLGLADFPWPVARWW